MALHDFYLDILFSGYSNTSSLLQDERYLPLFLWYPSYEATRNAKTPMTFRSHYADFDHGSVDFDETTSLSLVSGPSLGRPAFFKDL